MMENTKKALTFQPTKANVKGKPKCILLIIAQILGGVINERIFIWENLYC